MGIPRLEVRNTPSKGKALFTLDRIAEGQVVAEFKGREYTAERASVLPNEPPLFVRDHAVQTGPTTYIYADGNVKYIAHSCDPNCGIEGTTTIVAMRQINPDEEVTYDYAMTENSDWRMECACEADICRSEIGAFDDLPEEIRRKYGNRISDWLLEL